MFSSTILTGINKAGGTSALHTLSLLTCVPVPRGFPFRKLNVRVRWNLRRMHNKQVLQPWHLLSSLSTYFSKTHVLYRTAD